MLDQSAGAPASIVQPKGHMSSGQRLLLIWGSVAAVVLIGGGVAAWVVLRTVPGAAPAPVAPAPVPEAPTPSPAPRPLPAPVPPQPVAKPPPTPVSEAARDQDSDGLSDQEEVLFGLNPAQRDSDSDGFPDALELVNLYNPSGKAPAGLLDAGLVYAYRSDTRGWSLLIPRSWTVKAMGIAEGDLVVEAGVAGEQVSISVRANSAELPLRTFISQRPDGAALAPVERIDVKSGIAGARLASEPHRAWFTLTQNLVLELSYTSESAAYPFARTFDTMVQSVAIEGHGGAN